jgi:hypothetical protein
MYANLIDAGGLSIEIFIQLPIRFPYYFMAIFCVIFYLG